MFTPADLGLDSEPGTGAAATERRILHSARTLLAGGGVEACSMRAVAEASDITPGAIYRHFPNKQALVDRVVALAFTHFEQSLLEAIVSLPVGSFARLAALGEAYIRFAGANEEEFRVLFMPPTDARRKLEDVPGRAGYPILRRCVVEAMESGEVREADPDLVALFLWSRVHGIVMLLLACDLRAEMPGEAATGPIELFELTRDFVLSGLRGDG